MLDAKTFSDKDIVTIAQEKLISLKINGYNSNNKKLHEKYNVSKYPVIILLDKNLTEINRLPGYINKTEFKLKLNNAFKTVL